MRHLHGGLHIPERIGGDHAAKERHVQGDRSDLCSLDCFLQVLCFQRFDLLERLASIQLLLHDIRNRLNILRRIEDNLGSIISLFVLFAVFVAKAAEFW